MTKIQIGWKAKDKVFDGYWLHPLINGKPIDNDTDWDNGGFAWGLEGHPEQPEIPWDKSLQPVYIEVEDV